MVALWLCRFAGRPRLALFLLAAGLLCAPAALLAQVEGVPAGCVPPAEETCEPPADTLEGSSAEDAFRRGLAQLAATPRDAASSFELALARGYRPPDEAYTHLGLAYKQVPLRKLAAIRAFRQALRRREPPALDALYEFADTYLSLDGWEAQREARRALVGIVMRDPFYRDAWSRWQSLYLDEAEHRNVARTLRAAIEQAFDPRVTARVADLYVQIGDVEKLETLLDEWREQGGEVTTPFHYSLSRLLFLRGREAEGTASFLEGLERAQSSADLAPYWEDLGPLLAPSDRELAELRSLGGEVTFIRAFWEARDPLPFSPVNERLAEQYRRIEQARARYLWKKPLAKEKVIGAYVDDLGRPSFDTRLEGRSVDDRGTIYLRHGEPNWRNVEVGGGEYWRYDRPGAPGDRLKFHFKLMDGPMGRGNDTVYSVLPTTEQGAANTRLGHAGQEGVENTILGLSSDSYAHDYGNDVFGLGIAGASFRSQSGRARTEILLAVGVPLARLDDGEGERAAAVVQQLKLYDADYREQLVLRDTIPLRGGEGKSGALVGAFRIEDYPGQRRYAVQVDVLPSGALGLERGELTLPSYAERRLQLSDILFASRVSPAAVDPDAPEREGFAIRPLLTGGLDRSQPLHLYYEIYDLTADQDAKARYRVEYAVSAEKRVEPSLLARVFGGSGAARGDDEVAVAFERERPGPVERAPETISLDLSSLPPGRYRVAVSVRDLTTSNEASTVVVLDLLDEAAGGAKGDR